MQRGELVPLVRDYVVHAWSSFCFLDIWTLFQEPPLDGFLCFKSCVSNVSNEMGSKDKDGGDDAFLKRPVLNKYFHKKN